MERPSDRATGIGDGSARAVDAVLDPCLIDPDARCAATRARLAATGVTPRQALTLIARHKSARKYGYEIDPATLERLLDLAGQGDVGAPLQRLVDAPFLLVKLAWLYEHAPFFMFLSASDPGARDAMVLEFARRYEAEFLNSRVDIAAWPRLPAPRRVMITTFWESNLIDPLLFLDRARQLNVEGIELSLDFHPFNGTRLLPEEISPDRRERIRAACARTGLHLDIHAPIVGPYVPSPDPAKGKQRFYDPLACRPLHGETIDLARDAGARVVVLHLIDPAQVLGFASLVERAAGSDVRVCIENYCLTRTRQTSAVFVAAMDALFVALPAELRARNLGITLDVGHLNIEGEDPLIAAERIGLWCRDRGVSLRVHATDNYGKLLFSPPAFSADVHSNVSGRGINNSLVIRMLRSMGHRFDVVAEQLQPLSTEDIATIDTAQTCALGKTFEDLCREGDTRLAHKDAGSLLDETVRQERAYQFVAGLCDLPTLQEHIVYRKIQNKKHLSVHEAKRISQNFMRMPQRLRSNLAEYIDDLLWPVQNETGAMSKTDIDLICQNISGAVFTSIGNEHLDRIFCDVRAYADGELLCEQDRPSQDMYYLKDGQVGVFLDGMRVATLGPGEIVGEIGLFYHTSRSASLRALGPVTVGVLTRERLEFLFRHGQPYTRDLIERLYNILPERLRNLNDKYKTAMQALLLVVGPEKEGERALGRRGVRPEPADLLPDLSAAEAAEVFVERRELKAGELVFAEGTEADGAYYVAEGRVGVFVVGQNLEKIHLGGMQAGEVFGEMALIDDKPRSASVETLTACRLAFVGRRQFAEFIGARSDLAYRFMGFICLAMFRRIVHLDRMYADLRKRLNPT